MTTLKLSLVDVLICMHFIETLLLLLADMVIIIHFQISFTFACIKLLHLLSLSKFLSPERCTCFLLGLKCVLNEIFIMI